MYRQMQYFVAVVEAGSFSAAADACHISQSAISQQIQALERDLGVALLERRGRHFAVTPAGRYFYQCARRQLAELDSIVREARRIGSGEHQQLRVGVLTGFSRRIVQSAVNAFVQKHPNVRVSVTTGAHEAIFKRIMAGQLDLVINDQRRALADHFINDELGEQPLYALLRQGSAWAKQPFVELDALKESMCIVVSSAEQRENEASFWRDVVTVQGDILFVDSAEEACLNALAGNGWFVCDRDMDAPAGTALIPLRRLGVPLTRRMFAFWLESDDSPLKWDFSEVLHQYFS